MLKKLSCVFRLLIFLMFSASAQATERAELAWQKLAQGAVLIDVRTASEYQDKHLAGSINIAVQDFPTMDFSIFAKDEMIVLYCRSGNRSGRALDYLKSQGFTHLVNGGGLEEMLLVKPSP
ncbi:rhodanese-like domain-containing protein [Motilimonas pumila]|uniref:Rhodanese-like domain-containing protein n=1 Tax=Motilimonas pumila TaxID=2303987 RepID=A0A418YCY1_9GAMM|nr:rhodanese-like domain-containing protein [Motilimonas pumila]RJG42397.1 rhodanese-like domain-containing protein [Motilimonas pumila]